MHPDQDSIYQVNAAELEAGASRPLTQFGRAMQTLGVRMHCAHSPQAKGRVERRHAVFQDRLVKELRLAGIATLAAANDYLENSFLPDLNARFTVVAASATDLHRKLPRGPRLEEVLCWKETRVVAPVVAKPAARHPWRRWGIAASAATRRAGPSAPATDRISIKEGSPQNVGDESERLGDRLAIRTRHKKPWRNAVNVGGCGGRGRRRG